MLIRHTKGKLFMVICLALVSTARLWGGTSVWTNTSGGSWEAPANWTPNLAPGAGDDVVITNNGNYTVNLNASTAVASLTPGGTANGQALSINGGAVVLTVNLAAMNSRAILTGSGTLAVNSLFTW